MRNERKCHAVTFKPVCRRHRNDQQCPLQFCPAIVAATPSPVAIADTIKKKRRKSNGVPHGNALICLARTARWKQIYTEESLIHSKKTYEGEPRIEQQKIRIKKH